MTAQANAVAETFFATLKKELIHRRSWPDRAELRREVFDYIEIFYNTRRHSTLGMLSPLRYEDESISLKQPNIINNNGPVQNPDSNETRADQDVHQSGGSPHP